MEDAEREEGFIDVGSQRIRVLPGASDTAASFQFDHEDHTLGNALRYMIMKKHAHPRNLDYAFQLNLKRSPEVELCGYSIPHPSEAKMNLRIQTYEGTAVYDVLEKGLDDLMALCDAVVTKFTDARDDFATRMQS
ncbi:MAG: hypothetical protein LQ350_001141 [Teloschistes chrysophthalmus]|nr:MAG: hypothetical protein LQ350_001141 [Niorma chrysophthalma]